MSENKREDSSVDALEIVFDRCLVVSKEESFEFGNLITMGEYRPQIEDSFMNDIYKWPEQDDESIIISDVQPRTAFNIMPFSNRAEFEETPLTEATQRKNVLLMAECLSNDPSTIDRRNFIGFTALHYAAKDGFMEGINLLLENHCILDQQNFLGWTPLMVAINSKHFDVANRLLDAGASPYLLSPEFESAITLAASQSEYQLLNRLIYTPSVCKDLRDQILSFALIHAAEKENITLAKAIIESDADLYFCLPNQMPPLNISAGNGFDILVQRLIAAGAPLDSRDKWNLTPLMQAASFGHLFTCSILCRNGADVNAVCEGKTAKDMASEMGHREVAKYLQELMD
ncbi:unnamed protein product [Hymenolepis diminuta]|uniref:ANK_REP_REGION domain-containing protein n=1 Tax=Hymenolepis diminuta TaxID=6216 RepID=A0A0R3S7N7_HYMDI|nr:unnamed protein product [Hymenolepis diminuta]